MKGGYKEWIELVVIMVQGEESSWRMAASTHHERAIPLNQALAYGVQAHASPSVAAAPPASFFGGSGSDGRISRGQAPHAGDLPFMANEAATAATQFGSTTDSSSAQNTMPQMELVSPASIRASSEHQHQQQQPGQEVMMVTTDDYSYKPGLAAASPSFQQQHQLQHHQQQQLHGGDHDKRKHGSTRKDGKSVDAKFLDMYLLAPVSFLTWLNLLGRWVFSDRTEISAKQRGCEEEQAEKKGDEKKPVNSNFKTSSKDCFPIACLCAKPRDQQGQASADRARTPKSTQQLQPASLQLADEGVPRSSHHGAVKSFAGAAMFDMEYARWLDDDSKRLTDLRGGLQAHLLDTNLGLIVEECMQHYDELFQLKAALARSDVFHLLTGTWATPAERCFLWMGGFRPSDLLKILIQQLDPLTEQQMLGIYSLQQSSEQAEEALAQGLQQLHQSLADTVAAGTLNDGPGVPNYMSLMAIALDKLASLESFYQQVRQQLSIVIPFR
uniref:DOG1 domain-containing protein n=1 Tax=Oryza nivara TaxID=4536 RepID=A0A0E0H6K6_ORYNI